jgi:dsDNA-specific endonuclease/ATPase MutS2
LTDIRSHIDEQTANDLEFPVIREMLVSYCAGPTAAKAMGELRPYRSPRDARQKLEQVNELLSVRKEDGAGFPRLEFEELEKDIKRLKMNNASLFLEGIIRVYQASLLCHGGFLAQ